MVDVTDDNTANTDKPLNSASWLLAHEVFGFLKAHWIHALLAIPLAIGFTIVHEAAHAVAVLIQGGTVLELVWVPRGNQWGHIQYEFPPGSRYSAFFISVAPYLFWTLCAVVCMTVALVRGPALSFRLASTIFVWLYVAPLADIANAAFPYLAGSENDFMSAFGPANNLITVLIPFEAAVTVGVGFYVHRRLYRGAALSLGAYLILSTLTITGICLITIS